YSASRLLCAAACTLQWRVTGFVQNGPTLTLLVRARIACWRTYDSWKIAGESATPTKTPACAASSSPAVARAVSRVHGIARMPISICLLSRGRHGKRGSRFSHEPRTARQPSSPGRCHRFAYLCPLEHVPGSQIVDDESIPRRALNGVNRVAANS